MQEDAVFFSPPPPDDRETYIFSARPMWMQTQTSPLATDRRFFDALIAADLKSLEQILAEDFILIDVMSGSENTRSAMLSAIGERQIKFEAIVPSENRVRTYGNVAVVTGRTQMDGRVGESPFSAKSRYTHVFVEQQGEWRMVAAQGTPIPGE
jgi:ketosteroid isomerase-like protein